jgi:hypothetical protein
MRLGRGGFHQQCDRHIWEGGFASALMKLTACTGHKGPVLSVAFAPGSPSNRARAFVQRAGAARSRLLSRIPAAIKARMAAVNSKNQPQYCVGC